MTQDDCAAIVRCLPVIRQLAKGKPVYFASFRYDGKFLGWNKATKILIGPLHCGFYVVKPRYRCVGEKMVPVPGSCDPNSARSKRKV